MISLIAMFSLGFSLMVPVILLLADDRLVVSQLDCWSMMFRVVWIGAVLKHSRRSKPPKWLMLSVMVYADVFAFRSGRLSRTFDAVIFG